VADQEELAKEEHLPNTESGKLVLTPLERVRAAARKDKGLRFTSLLHHVNRYTLKEAYNSLKRGASAGVDGMTWHEYGKDLDVRLQDLLGRVHRGGYHAKPSRRVYIPKADGRQRPLGIASLEDKIVQSAVAKVMHAIYEEDFLGFSYGFRPGRSQHDALDSLTVGIYERNVNWVLDADISGFFDAIDHECLMKMIECRIGDTRVLRLIQKWLNAGVLEDGRIMTQEKGTPQGANISPLLANIYLHHVFDLWAHQWRQQHARGDVVIVRYADDFVVGFQHRGEVERFLREVRDRFAQFKLELHPDKTRLIEFGRNAESARRGRGQGKPETFDFLGFTHISAKTRNGKFMLRRHTIRKRLRATLAAIKVELQVRMHKPVVDVGKWLRKVVNGYFNYHAIRTNRKTLVTLRREVGRMWLQTLRRRSHRDRTTWDDFIILYNRWIPQVAYRHPWPSERFARRHYSR
jgi:group II intron reverse transcriptase/maturase